MAIADGYIPSNVTPFRFGPMTASATGKRKDFVIVLNPGTTGTVKEGADTASAVLIGLATDDFDQVADAAKTPTVTDIPVDCGGAIVERTYTGVAAADVGRLVYVAGPDSVAASGNVAAGRVVKYLGSNRCTIKCAPFAHLAGATGATGATGPTGPTGPT
jgi:hypothetical protein